MKAIDVLIKYQKQLDPDGIEVGVSRQALNEVIKEIAELQSLLDRQMDINDEINAEHRKERANDSLLLDANAGIIVKLQFSNAELMNQLEIMHEAFSEDMFAEPRKELGAVLERNR